MPKIKHLIISEPLPNEVLASILLRTISRYGRLPTTPMIYKILNRRIRNLHTDNLVQDFKELSNVLEHTEYLYYLNGIPKARQKSILETISKGENVNMTFCVNRHKNQGNYRETLYFCPECYIEDKELYGTPYFKVYHQIGGINCCPEHGCKLVSFTGTSYSDFINIDLPDSERATEMEWILAKRLLSFKGYSKEELDTVIWKKLEEKGFIKEDKIIDKKKIISYLAQKLDIEILMNNGIFIEKPMQWLYYSIWIEKYISPAVYLIFLIALEITDENIRENKSNIVSKFTHNNIKTKRCKNPYCSNEVIACYTSKKNSYYRCPSCGTVFTNTSIVQYSESLLSGINQYYKDGLSINTIAKKTGLSRPQVSRILKGKIDPHYIDNKIENAKVKAINFETQKEFENSCRSEYRILSIYNREYLSELFAGKNKRVDKSDLMKFRDEKYYQYLLDNEEFIMRVDEKITKQFFLRYLKLSDFNHIQRYYPKTTNFIQNHLENQHQSYLRRGKIFLAEKDIDHKISKKEFIKHFSSKESGKAYDELMSEQNSNNS